jgi:hypothetical protein
MPFHYSHKHMQDVRGRFQPGLAPDKYAAVVGTPVKGEDKPITGPSGDHLQFYIDAGDAGRYQVDVNTQSKDGSAVEVYVAVEQAPQQGTDAGGGSGLPALGIFPDAELSYRSLGLKEADFAPLSYYRIDSLLSAALDQADVVSAYGMTFDDGGANGKGIHDIHMDSNSARGQDGALLVYSAKDGKVEERTWYFFKFKDENLTGPAGS